MSDWRNFSFKDNGVVVLMRKETYSRTESGKGWRKNPDEVENIVFDAERYENYVTAIPFFNNFGYGAYCRASCGYTFAGYIPVSITTVSPNREKKIIAHFDFIKKGDMEDKAGWREKEVLRNAVQYERETYIPVNGYGIGSRITFITDDCGVTHSATWDTNLRRWVD